MESTIINDIRTKVRLAEYKVENVHSTDFPGNYPGYDDSWNLDKFRTNFQVKVIRIKEDANFRIEHHGREIGTDFVSEMEFDMIGIDAAIANAIRRILLAEVPTMAIEKVHVYQNTSIIQDEVLAHRLGLIPIKADPDKFEFRPPPSDTHRPRDVSEDAGSEMDCLQFNLKVRCTKLPGARDASITDRDQLYRNHKITTKHLEWVPIGNQVEILAEPVRPVHDNILLAKLNPGQELELELFCEKGMGKDHTKFSPVATASYRMLPHIEIMRPVVGEDATRLQRCFSPGVIGIRSNAAGEREAFVENARRDTISRELFRHADLKECVKQERIRDHFIFSVESTGARPLEGLVPAAFSVLERKCAALLEALDAQSTRR